MLQGLSGLAPAAPLGTSLRVALSKYLRAACNPHGSPTIDSYTIEQSKNENGALMSTVWLTSRLLLVFLDMFMNILITLLNIILVLLDILLFS